MTAAPSKRYVKDKRGRAWSHKSVITLLKSVNNNDDPETLIRKAARQLVAQAKADGWSGPPYDPKILASLRGIKVEAVKGGIGADARIFPNADGDLVIEFDSSKPVARTNFSICHELTHTFFRDCYEEVRHRKKGDSYDHSYFELEFLCDLGAAELLMPEDSFSIDMEKLGISLNAVRDLSKLYIASSEAVLIRMGQLSLRSCAVIFLSEKLKPTEKRNAQTMDLIGFELPPIPLKLRVDYTCPSKAFSVFIPRDKSVPDNSVSYQCLKTNDVVEGVEHWDIQGFGLWRVQAVPLPSFNTNGRRVVAFVSAE